MAPSTLSLLSRWDLQERRVLFFSPSQKVPSHASEGKFPQRRGGPSQEPLVDSEGYEKKISRSASRKRKKADAAKAGSGYAAVGLVIANMVMGAESFIVARQQTSFSRTRLYRIGTPTTLLITTFLQLMDWLTRLQRFHQRKF